MKIFSFYFFIFQIHRKIFRHFFRQCRRQNSKTFFDCFFCLFYKILNLTRVWQRIYFLGSLAGRRAESERSTSTWRQRPQRRRFFANTLPFRNRSHYCFWIYKSSRTNDLLHNLFALSSFFFTWSCTSINYLPDAFLKFFIF